MPIDREDTLKKAEKLLRQGRLDAAIAEYLRVVEDQPHDWATANTLGDLYVRAAQTDKASVQYGRIAEHFMNEGFYPKASAIYKKLLKLSPDDEVAQLNLADISHKQGLLADAKTRFQAIAARRRNRGDKAGAAEIVVRLGAIDPVDFDARLAAARTLVEMGNEEDAATRFRGIYDDLLEKGRRDEALDALREAVRSNPYDQSGRVLLATAAVEAGDFEGARAFLDRETAGEDPALQMALLEMDLKSGQIDEARELLTPLLAIGPEQRQRIIDLAWSLAASNQDAAFVVVESSVEFSAAESNFVDAAGLLQEFAARVPNQIPALLKLIEICVDGGLEFAMYEAQAQLTDAYLKVGQAAEARVIAEDLVAREPWERAHIDRFRRALVMLKVSEPDSLIAERLSGEAPFMATDVFADLPSRGGPPPQPPAENTAAEIEPTAAADEPMAPADVAPAAALPKASRPAAGEVDLTGSLDPDATGAEDPARSEAAPAAAPPETLGDVFEDFRNESSRQSSADQSAQHMTLARTYLEMGLQNEALKSLKTASKAPRFRFEAASQIGRIHQDRGETPQAIEWLERAAEAPPPSVEEGRALLYNLGALVEESGDTARALAVFLELQSEAGDYRDVAERVERLARVETGG